MIKWILPLVILASCQEPTGVQGRAGKGVAGNFEGPFGDTKIRISIGQPVGDSIFGQSTVKGFSRPFRGTYATATGGFTAKANEPGDSPEDGAFDFIFKGDSLTGIWTPNVTGTHGGVKELRLIRIRK